MFAYFFPGDYLVPAGCMINLQIFNVHRNPDQYPNPENFDPDNFLPERVAKRHPYAYIPFSAGPRNCIGQKFALLEQKTVLSSILRHFEVHAVENWRHLTLMNELILRPESGIRVQLVPRAITAT
jgi:cytochrome P450 family 4